MAVLKHKFSVLPRLLLTSSDCNLTSLSKFTLGCCNPVWTRHHIVNIKSTLVKMVGTTSPLTFNNHIKFTFKLRRRKSSKSSLAPVLDNMIPEPAALEG